MVTSASSLADWQVALLAFARRAPASVQWMLVGSAATAIRGVPVEPNDVDILVHPASSGAELTVLSESLSAFASSGPDNAPLADFVSSTDRPWADAGDWTFGRWRVTGVRLEVARIRSEVPPSVHWRSGCAVAGCSTATTRGEPIHAAARDEVWPHVIEFLRRHSARTSQ